MKLECRLKEILDSRGMKQTFLAKKVGISNGTLSLIVRGKSVPTLPVALRIVEELGVKVEDIWVKMGK